MPVEVGVVVVNAAGCGAGYRGSLTLTIAPTVANPYEDNTLSVHPPPANHPLDIDSMLSKFGVLMSMSSAVHLVRMSPMASMTSAAAISSAPLRVSTVPAELRPSRPIARWTKKPPDWASTPASSSEPASHCTPAE